MMECPYSTNSITLEELSVVEETAKSLGLYVTPRRLQASSSSRSSSSSSSSSNNITSSGGGRPNNPVY